MVGIIGGLLISYIYSTLHGALRLDAQPEPPRKTRTAKQYRESKRKEKAQAEAPLMSSGYMSLSDGMSIGRQRGSKGLLAQTIMEEMDSDY